MYQYLSHSQFYDQPVLLTKEEIAYPHKILERFFEDYRLGEIHHFNWEMVETCLTTDNVPYSEPEERASLLTRFKDMGKVFEAAYLFVELIIQKKANIIYTDKIASHEN
jgi:hypothetical protein